MICAAYYLTNAGIIEFRGPLMNIDYDDHVSIVISSVSHSDIKEISNELDELNIDEKRVDINKYLNNLKRKYGISGIGIGIEPGQLGWNQAMHDSIKDGLTDDQAGYTICGNNQTIWYVTAEYINGNIIYVGSIHSIKTSLNLEVYVSYSYNDNKGYNRVQVNSAKYNIKAD